MYKQTLCTLITHFKRQWERSCSLWIKNKFSVFFIGLDVVSVPCLPWSNKPTQVNKATPLICWSETSSFFPAFCHPSLDLRCFSHITHKDDAAFVGGWCLRVRATCRLEHRGNDDLLFGSVLLQHIHNKAVSEYHRPAGQQEKGILMKRRDVSRMWPVNSECTWWTCGLLSRRLVFLKDVIEV